MKNKLHTLWAAFGMIIVVAAVVWGGMHHVFAKRSSEPEKAFTIDKNAGSKDIADSGINGGIKSKPVVELTVEKNIEPSLYLSSSLEELSQGGTVEKEEHYVGGISYDDLVMADVMEAVNIREEPSEDSPIIGKLYKECGGEILEEGEEWTKLKTGDVEGYVSNEYLLFGDPAVELALSVVNMVATSETSCLRVRLEPSEDAKILGLLAEGDKIDVMEDLGDWVKTGYSDGTECYVSSKYVSIESELPCGESMEAIKKREAALKAEAKAAEKEAAQGSKSPDNSGSAQSTTYSGLNPSSVDDLTLLASIIQCEAGYEVFEGQVAIGNVILNRLVTGRYGSSIYSVIYAKSQFGPAGSGKVAQVYANGPKATCIAAAKAALSGTNYVGNATSFRNVASGHTGIVIGNHVFW